MDRPTVSILIIILQHVRVIAESLYARIHISSLYLIVGSYCEWKINLTVEERVYNCFEELQEDLFLDCDNNNTEYTEFIFTPNASHPDTLYYQVNIIFNAQILLY